MSERVLKIPVFLTSSGTGVPSLGVKAEGSEGVGVKAEGGDTEVEKTVTKVEGAGAHPGVESKDNQRAWLMYSVH